ncbi:MAG: N-formylglutamate amidohydrolase [Acidobacteriota bacterium]
MTARPQIVDHLTPLEWVPFEPAFRDGPADDTLLVYTIHDGADVPRHLWLRDSETVLERPEILATYIAERDWGADRVARAIARRLGLGGYLRVRLARLVLDFGRFPGASAVGESYLRRHAVYPPVEDLLTPEAIEDLLARYYDAISRQMCDHSARKRLLLAVHTYDPRNVTGTERPELSLVERSMTYQRKSTLPPHVFDPLFPPQLVETTCARRLTYEVALACESAGWPTAIAYPYTMPEGSMEIRAIAWSWFRHLRACFTAARPDRSHEPMHPRVWQMLLDVTRRGDGCDLLREAIHCGTPIPGGAGHAIDARAAYDEIRDFAERHQDDLLASFSASADRFDCLGLEVRKDLLSDLGDDGELPRPLPDADTVADQIAVPIADGIGAWCHARGVPVARPAAVPATPHHRSFVTTH